MNRNHSIHYETAWLNLDAENCWSCHSHHKCIYHMNNMVKARNLAIDPIRLGDLWKSLSLLNLLALHHSDNLLLKLWDSWSIGLRKPILESIPNPKCCVSVENQIQDPRGNHGIALRPSLLLEWSDCHWSIDASINESKLAFSIQGHFHGSSPSRVSAFSQRLRD